MLPLCKECFTYKDHRASVWIINAQQKQVWISCVAINFLGTNISLTQKGIFEDDAPFPKVGYELVPQQVFGMLRESNIAKEPQNIFENVTDGGTGGPKDQL